MKTTTIFFYNVVKIKSDFRRFFNPAIDRFILIASSGCISALLATTKDIFEDIIEVENFEISHIQPLVEQIIKKYPDKIRILCNEESCAITAATLRELYSLDGPRLNQVMPFVDKVLMKRQLADSPIRKPKYYLFDKNLYKQEGENYLQTIADDLTFPLIAKPVDGFGSVATEKLNDFASLKKYVNQNGHIIFEIDEFIQGELFHCDGLVKNKEVIFMLTSIYNTPCINFTKNIPLGSLIIQDNHPLKKNIECFVKEVVSFLNPPDGAFHLEFFVNSANELIFLEMGARTPGAAVIPAYESMVNINYEEQHYRLQMGSEPDIHSSSIRKYCAWLMFPINAGVVRGYNSININSEYKITYFLKENQKTECTRDLLDIAAVMLIYNESYQRLQQDIKYLETFNPIIYKESVGA